MAPTSEELLDLISETAKVERDKLTPEAPLRTLGVDSIGVVEIAFAIEDKYGIEIPLNANTLAGSESSFSTVEDIVNMVQGLIEQKIAA